MTTPKDQRKFNSHDDPVVVDNGPLRIDFGGSEDHKPTKHKHEKKWMRDCTEFARLVVTVVKGESEPETSTFALAEGKPIFLDLKNGGSTGPKTSHMTISTETGQVVVESPHFKHELDSSSNPRFLKSDENEKPLVTAIRMFRRSAPNDEFTFRPRGDAGSRVLLITLFPVPEGYVLSEADSSGTAPS